MVSTDTGEKEAEMISNRSMELNHNYLHHSYDNVHDDAAQQIVFHLEQTKILESTNY